MFRGCCGVPRKPAVIAADDADEEIATAQLTYKQAPVARLRNGQQPTPERQTTGSPRLEGARQELLYLHPVGSRSPGSRDPHRRGSGADPVRGGPHTSSATSVAAAEVHARLRRHQGSAFGAAGSSSGSSDSGPDILAASMSEVASRRGQSAHQRASTIASICSTTDDIKEIIEAQGTAVMHSPVAMSTYSFLGGGTAENRSSPGLDSMASSMPSTPGRDGGHPRLQPSSTMGCSMESVTDLSSEADASTPPLDIYGLAGLSLGRLIGHGGFGDVYQGVVKGSPCAVKIICHRWPDSKRAKQQATEIAIMHEVKHPAVVSLLHYAANVPISAVNELLERMERPSTRGGQERRSPETERSRGDGALIVEDPEDYCCTVIVMELAEKGSVHKFLSYVRKNLGDAWRRPKMLVHVWKLALDVAEGMEYLHLLGVLHGDLTSSNVLVSKDSESALGYHARIADFGISAAMHMKEASGGSVATVATVTHRAPELLDTSLKSRKSDVYSFGILLWELYTAQQPWEGASAPHIILSVVDGQRPVFPPCTPPGYEALARRCWLQRPEDRPEFSEIVELLISEPALVPPPAGSGSMCSTRTGTTTRSTDEASGATPKPGREKKEVLKMTRAVYREARAIHHKTLLVDRTPGARTVTHRARAKERVPTRSDMFGVSRRGSKQSGGGEPPGGAGTLLSPAVLRLAEMGSGVGSLHAQPDRRAREWVDSSDQGDRVSPSTYSSGSRSRSALLPPHMASFDAITRRMSEPRARKLSTLRQEGWQSVRAVRSPPPEPAGPPGGEWPLPRPRSTPELDSHSDIFLDAEESMPQTEGAPGPTAGDQLTASSENSGEHSLLWGLGGRARLTNSLSADLGSSSPPSAAGARAALQRSATETLPAPHSSAAAASTVMESQHVSGSVLSFFVPQPEARWSRTWGGRIRDMLMSPFAAKPVQNSSSGGKTHSVASFALMSPSDEAHRDVQCGTDDPLPREPPTRRSAEGTTVTLGTRPALSSMAGRVSGSLQHATLPLVVETPEVALNRRASVPARAPPEYQRRQSPEQYEELSRARRDWSKAQYPAARARRQDGDADSLGDGSHLDVYSECDIQDSMGRTSAIMSEILSTASFDASSQGPRQSMEDPGYP